MSTGLQFGWYALAFLAASGTFVHAAELGTAGIEPDSAQVDAIVRKLESSGVLDAAVERAIDRYVMRKEQARAAEEAQKQATNAMRARPVDPVQDHILGTTKAEVSMIEYTDIECPFCKQFHGRPKALLDRYGGRVNWVLRNFPLPFHDPAARNEALAAECVARLRGNEAYWKYMDALFANTKSNGAGLPPERSVEKLAANVGVRAGALAKCMSDPAMMERVEQDISDGTAAGVTGTPTTVIRNNRTGVSQAVVGARSVETLARIIDQLLAGNQ